MLKRLSIVAVAVILTGFGAGESISQENIDRTDLVTKTDAGEFVVEGAERIDLDRALELYSEGAVFVDLRNVWRYDIAHIRGAVGLELNTQFSESSLAQHAAKEQPVVFYCNHSACPRSAIASAMALEWGYTNVYHFADGWSAWSGNNHDQD
ncbi:rhodanese-like domain-containing protein [Tropicibacter sp. Alg240-R139]|uniref:rhodanese-like domain-containing protein n=1 Tax=Tropicibacter sp. Alg240-R139 TaxID=2305991 RepID=UPI0013E0CDB6|nr:rhodanese-like domain-containing protein [Tropicibacter sp. Alg240-R139]